MNLRSRLLLLISIFLAPLAPTSVASPQGICDICKSEVEVPTDPPLWTFHDVGTGLIPLATATTTFGLIEGDGFCSLQALDIPWSHISQCTQVRGCTASHFLEIVYDEPTVLPWLVNLNYSVVGSVCTQKINVRDSAATEGPILISNGLIPTDCGSECDYRVHVAMTVTHGALGQEATTAPQTHLYQGTIKCSACNGEFVVDDGPGPGTDDPNPEDGSSIPGGH